MVDRIVIFQGKMEAIQGGLSSLLHEWHYLYVLSLKIRSADINI